MTDRPVGPEHAQSGTDRLAQWWSGWRVAIVTAWRDARQHRGTTALIMIMIGLPVLLITGFGTLVSTTQVSSAEALHWELGDAAAKVVASVEGGRIIQSPEGEILPRPDSSCSSGTCEAAKPRTWTSADIARAVAGDAYAVDSGRATVTQHDRPLVVPALTLDQGGFAATGIATLRSGTWPTAADQVLVSPEMVSHGLPPSGTITVTLGNATRTLTVVGTAKATDDQGAPYDLLGLTGAFGTFANQDNPSFLIMRPQPFTWSEIVQLNTQGLSVVAPEFVLHPERADLTGDYASARPMPTPPIDTALVVLLVFGLLLETTLLAGPAFAVSTARRRRTLALVASNGGTRQQLRRYVLGQGLVMGVLAALIGAALGVLAPAIGFPVADHLSGSRVPRGPFEPNWATLTFSAVAAVLAALVAASIAARGTSRLEIAQALAGRTQPRARHGARHLALPVIATLITTGALAGCAIVVVAPDPQSLLMPAAFLSIIATLGSLLLVGTVIDLVGRIDRGPIAMRIALRDGRRNRSRTLPAVAAIAATVAVVTMLTISNTSDMAQQIRDYTPMARYGDAVVYTGDASGRATLAEVRRQHPNWQFLPISYLGEDVTHSDHVGRTAAIIPTGCDPRNVLNNNNGAGKCSADYPSIVAPAAAALHQLPADAAAAITDGAAVVVDDPGLAHDGQVTIAVSSNGEITTSTVPAVVVQRSALAGALPSQLDTSCWIPPRLVERHHLPTQPLQVVVHNPDGPITTSEEKAINERLPISSLQVERGPIVGATKVLLVGMLAVGGFLALVAALIATALGRAESRADLATISAVGASGRSLRRIAAAQALLVSVVGVGQGFLTGLLPGMALAAALTGTPLGDLPPRPIILIPWAHLLGALAGAALLAGVLAAVSVRRLPLVRRVE